MSSPLTLKASHLRIGENRLGMIQLSHWKCRLAFVLRNSRRLKNLELTEYLLQEAQNTADELKRAISSKEEDLLAKNATIQKMEKQIEKLRSAKEKEQKTLTALEMSRSLDAGNANSSDHLSIAAGEICRLVWRFSLAWSVARPMSGVLYGSTDQLTVTHFPTRYLDLDHQASMVGPPHVC